MRIWTTEAGRADAHTSIGWVDALTRSLGDPACSRAMLDVLNQFARVDHCALFISLRGPELRLLGASSRVAHANGARAALRYMDGMHLHDLGQDGAVAAAEADPSQVRLKYRTRDEVVNQRYRIACYDHVDIEDRLSMSRPRGDGTAALLHCYRDKSTGRFVEAELDALTKAASFLLSFVEVHAKLAVPREIPLARWREALDHNAGAALSSRELDVCAHLLSGRTLADTGLVLGLSVNTVITYSRRAYAKFGVASARELHGLITLA